MIAVLQKVRGLASGLLAWIAGAAVLCMVLLACANILGRLFGSPIEGAYEVMGFLGAIAASFALGSSQLAKGHVAVTILDEHLPRAARRLLDAAGALTGCLFFGVAGYEVIDLGNFMVSTGELSETLRIPYYPFVWAVGGGCLVMALVLLTDVFLALGAGSARETPTGEAA